MDFKKGDSIKVNEGVLDPDSGTDISGFQGRVTEVEDSYVSFLWDSISLRAMGQEVIDKYEAEGFNWATMVLSCEEVSLTEERDTSKDVKEAIAELGKFHVYLHLDNGKEVAEILKGIDPKDTTALEARWFDYLEETLRLPVKAEIFEGYSRGEFKVGDKVTIIDLDDISEDYGILAKIENKNIDGYRPLCDLEVLNRKLKNYRAIADYTDWFVNARSG